MHDIEPFYNWREYYVSEEDRKSTFYRTQHSEFEFSRTVYNHFIHPQWDEFGSATLYLKVLYVNYDAHFCIIEFIGEWNDTLYNDIMYLYRNVIEELLANDICYFILIGENVLEFHSDTPDYYEEWFDNLGDGWIIGINFRKHVIREFKDANIDFYVYFGGIFNEIPWRNYMPEDLFRQVELLITKRLNE